MRKRHVKFLAAGALAAAMVIANLPVTSTLYMDSVETAEAAEVVDATVNITDSTISDTSKIKVDSSTDSGVAVYKISTGGTYEFTGSSKNVAIEVAEGKNAELILNNMIIDDSSTVASAQEAVITLGKNSTVSINLTGDSVIKCSNSDASKIESAILHTKNKDNVLTVCGSGSLEISGSTGDAIKAKKGVVNIESGNITITDCYGDGIEAATVNISGGNLDITTIFDSASTQYYTSGTSSVSGYNTIWESGSTKYERVNVDTGSHKGIKAGIKAKTEIYSDDSSNNEVTESSGGLYISGGTVTVNTLAAGLKANAVSGSYKATSTGVYIIGAPDDGLHSNNDMSITGGTINVYASDDGITAANDLTITGTPDINIYKAYEGIEGATIVIGESGASTGPSIDIES